MEKLDEKLLKYCGIFKTPKTYEKEKEVMKIKKDLEKVTGLKIEKAYVWGEGFWGKDDKKQRKEAYCFLVDERLKTIDKIFDKVHEYNNEHDCGQILFWSLCQFEKRKQSKGELDYYIANYGYLVYDSKKDVDVDEKIKVTNYAGVMDYYRFAKKHLISNRNDVWMEKLLELYIAKIGYFFEERLLELNELVEYVRYISSDKTIENLIKKYLKEKDDKQKVEICKEFEKYLKTVKQNRIKYKLSVIKKIKINIM